MSGKIDYSQKYYGVDSDYSICFGDGEEVDSFHLNFKVIPEEEIVAFGILRDNPVTTEEVLYDEYPIWQAVKGAGDVADYAIDTPYTVPDADPEELELNWEENNRQRGRFINDVAEQVRAYEED